MTNRMYRTNTIAVLEYPTPDMAIPPFCLQEPFLSCYSIYPMSGRADVYGRMSIRSGEKVSIHLDRTRLGDEGHGCKRCKTACVPSLPRTVAPGIVENNGVELEPFGEVRRQNHDACLIVQRLFGDPRESRQQRLKASVRAARLALGLANDRDGACTAVASSDCRLSPRGG